MGKTFQKLTSPVERQEEQGGRRADDANTEEESSTEKKSSRLTSVPERRTAAKRRENCENGHATCGDFLRVGWGGRDTHVARTH